MEKQNGYLRLSGTGENSVAFEGECLVTAEGRQTTIEFDESSAGYEGTRTFLVVSDDLMTLNRIGEFATTMIFEPSRENPVSLGSPFGTIEMRLLTEKLSISRSDAEVDVTAHYRFLLGGESMQNVLKVECRTLSSKYGGN